MTDEARDVGTVQNDQLSINEGRETLEQRLYEPCTVVFLGGVTH